MGGSSHATDTKINRSGVSGAGGADRRTTGEADRPGARGGPGGAVPAPWGGTGLPSTGWNMLIHGRFRPAPHAVRRCDCRHPCADRLR